MTQRISGGDKPKGYAPLYIIEKYLLGKYQFRRNTVLNRTEYKGQGGEFFPITEYVLNSIHRDLSHAGLRCNKSTVKDLLESDYVPNVDPFEEYIKGLQEWKAGDPDYIQHLADTVITTQPEVWSDWFKRWLVAVVACAINPTYENQQVLVLVGRQGIGKTKWLNKLLPLSLTGYLYSGLVNPNSKDTLVNLAENLLILLDELENLNKTELGSLKALITQSAIRLRRAYGVYNENFLRRASFMASVNDAEFLTDTTGNRRYLCFDCISINYNHDILMDKVYAQAYALYKANAIKYWFDDREIEKIEALNEQHLKVTAEEELLTNNFKKPFAGEAYFLATPTQIAGFLTKKSGFNLNNNTSINRIGMALRKHDFEKVSKGSSKPYKVILGLHNSLSGLDYDPEVLNALQLGSMFIGATYAPVA